MRNIILSHNFSNNVPSWEYFKNVIPNLEIAVPQNQVDEYSNNYPKVVGIPMNRDGSQPKACNYLMELINQEPDQLGIIFDDDVKICWQAGDMDVVISPINVYKAITDLIPVIQTNNYRFFGLKNNNLFPENIYTTNKWFWGAMGFWMKNDSLYFDESFPYHFISDYVVKNVELFGGILRDDRYFLYFENQIGKVETRDIIGEGKRLKQKYGDKVNVHPTGHTEISM